MGIGNVRLDEPGDDSPERWKGNASGLRGCGESFEA
jgi:hypothetical protein